MAPEELRTRLDAALGRLDETAGGEELLQALRILCHDVNNVLGTIGLELYSVGAILDDVAVHVPPSDLAELRSAVANCEGARASGEALIGALHDSARALDPQRR